MTRKAKWFAGFVLLAVIALLVRFNPQKPPGAGLASPVADERTAHQFLPSNSSTISAQGARIESPVLPASSAKATSVRAGADSSRQIAKTEGRASPASTVHVTDFGEIEFTDGVPAPLMLDTGQPCVITSKSLYSSGRRKMELQIVISDTSGDTLTVPKVTTLPDQDVSVSVGDLGVSLHPK